MHHYAHLLLFIALSNAAAETSCPELFQQCVVDCAEKKCHAPPSMPSPPMQPRSNSSHFQVDFTVYTCQETEKEVASCAPLKAGLANDVKSVAYMGNGDPTIVVENDTLKMWFDNSKNAGPRVYLTENATEQTGNLMLYYQSTVPEGQPGIVAEEIAFDVLVSEGECAMNLAFYSVAMNRNDDLDGTGRSLAANGKHYCDAQAVDGTFCPEMDHWEGNKMASQFTTHGCTLACNTFNSKAKCQGDGATFALGNTWTGQTLTTLQYWVTNGTLPPSLLLTDDPPICDNSGVGWNPFRYGPGTTWDIEYPNTNFYGPDSSHNVDTSDYFTVVMQFRLDDDYPICDNNQGEHAKECRGIRRAIIQNKKVVVPPAPYILHSDSSNGDNTLPLYNANLSEYFAKSTFNTNEIDGVGPFTIFTKNMKDTGQVAAMSFWNAPETYVNGQPVPRPEDFPGQTGMSWMDGLNDWGGKIIRTGPCDVTTPDPPDSRYGKIKNMRFGKIGTTVDNKYYKDFWVKPPPPPP